MTFVYNFSHGNKEANSQIVYHVTVPRCTDPYLRQIGTIITRGPEEDLDEASVNAPQLNAGFSPKEMCVVRNSRKEEHLDKYDLRKKAYVLVFHHYKFDDSASDRLGSDKDMERVDRFFRAYRVDPLNVCANKTAAEVRYIMDMIARKDFSDYSCLIIIVMSHGLMHDQIEARDGKTYCFEGDIVEKCTSNRTLDGKPKLFIVQACRGDSLIVTDAKKASSEKSDVLIFQSSYRGFVSLRDPQEGTFFIQHFFRLLDEHRDKDIFNIIKRLNSFFKSSALPQNPTMNTTLRKDLIFDDLRM